MMPVRIRHGNASQGIALRACGRIGMAEKGESITNPSRTLVTDSERGKAKEYRKNNTLSPSLYESITYPPARCGCAYARTREGGATDSRDEFAGHGSYLPDWHEDRRGNSRAVLLGLFRRSGFSPRPRRGAFGAAVGERGPSGRTEVPPWPPGSPKAAFLGVWGPRNAKRAYRTTSTPPRRSRAAFVGRGGWCPAKGQGDDHMERIGLTLDEFVELKINPATNGPRAGAAPRRLSGSRYSP